MGYPPLPPLSTQVVQSVTTVYRGRGADVEAPNTPSVSATRKRLALDDNPSGRRGAQRRSRSPPALEQPNAPGLPHPYPAPLPVPAGSPRTVSPVQPSTAIAVQQHSAAHLGHAVGSDATSSHQGQQSYIPPILEAERELMRNMVWWYQQAATEDKQRMAEMYAQKYNQFEDAARQFQERARDDKDLALAQQAIANSRALLPAKPDCGE